MRRRGFTLIELLVVIAIIGILAAMLFPVFARARESARKIQCLSNVKNIAMAVQMYLTDYDAFPPANVDQAARAYFMQDGGGTGWQYCDPGAYNQGWWETNPYLKWPVVFDEYIKNRDVWHCPSGRLINGARWIVPEYTAPWWEYFAQNEGKWGGASGNCCFGPCWGTYPSGWGGAVTDSIAQQKQAVGNEHSGSDTEGAFTQTIAYNADNLTGAKTAELGDPSNAPVCADSNWDANWFTWFALAYGPRGYAESLFGVSGDACDRFCNEPGFRKQFAPHLGGLNVGFADGHAKWFDAEAAIKAGGDCWGGHFPGKCCYTVPPEQWEANCPVTGKWFGESQ